MGGLSASKQSTYAAQLFKGTKLFGQRKQNVTFIIVEHRVLGPEKCVPSIIEVVAYARSQDKPEEVQEAPRLYLSLTKIFQKLKLPSGDCAVSNSAENRSHTLDLVAKYIFGRVTVAEKPLSEGSDFKVELLPSADDLEDTIPEASNDILHDGPITLAQPYTNHVNDEFRAEHNLSEGAPESHCQSETKERKVYTRKFLSTEIPSARSKVATDAINAFLIMFARNRSLLEVGSSASKSKKSWMKAIRKVILKRNVHRTRATLRLRALQSSSFQQQQQQQSDTVMTVTSDTLDMSGKRKKDRKERNDVTSTVYTPSNSKGKITMITPVAPLNPLFPSVEKGSNGKKKDGSQDMKVLSMFPGRESKNEKMDIVPSPPSSLSPPPSTATYKSHKRNLTLPEINITANHTEEAVTSPKLNDRLTSKKPFSPSEVVIQEDSAECSAECSSPDVRDTLDLREIRICVRNSESVKKAPSTTRKTKLVILEEENENESETENEIARARKEEFEALIMKSEKIPCYNTSDVEEAMLRLQNAFNSKGYVRGNQREDEAIDLDIMNMKEKERDNQYLSKRRSLSNFEASKLLPKNLFSTLRGTSKTKPSKSEDFTLRQTENPRTAGLMWDKAFTSSAPTPPALPPLSSPSPGTRTPGSAPSPVITLRTSGIPGENSSRQVSKRTNSTTNSSHCATPVVFTDAIFDSAAYQTFNEDLESSLKNTYDFVFASNTLSQSSSNSIISPSPSPSPAKRTQRLSITPLKTPTTPIPSPTMTPAGSMRLIA